MAEIKNADMVRFGAGGRRKRPHITVVHNGKTLTLPISEKAFYYALESAIETARVLKFGKPSV